MHDACVSCRIQEQHIGNAQAHGLDVRIRHHCEQYQFYLQKSPWQPRQYHTRTIPYTLQLRLKVSTGFKSLSFSLSSLSFSLSHTHTLSPPTFTTNQGSGTVVGGGHFCDKSVNRALENTAFPSPKRVNVSLASFTVESVPEQQAREEDVCGRDRPLFNRRASADVHVYLPDTWFFNPASQHNSYDTCVSTVLPHLELVRDESARMCILKRECVLL